MSAHDVIALLDGLLVVYDDLAVELEELGCRMSTARWNSSRHVVVALPHLESHDLAKVVYLPWLYDEVRLAC